MSGFGALAVSLLVAVPAPATGGAYAWVPPLPRPLVVTRPFDPPAVRWAAGHRGVDLRATTGAIIVAAGAGRVSFAGQLAGRGVVVVVHGALRTTYEPVAVSLAVGAQVTRGAALGSLAPGHDPAHPGAAILHWGLLRGDVYLDPLSLLSAALPVRLLPLWDTAAPAVAGAPATALAEAVPRTARVAPRPVTGKPAAAGRPGARSGAEPLAVGAAVTLVLIAAAASRRPP